MAEDIGKHAIDVVAHQVVADLTENEIDDAWGLYPEIGEDDWLAVQKRAKEIVKALKPGGDPYDAAYEFLEGRANAETDA